MLPIPRDAQFHDLFAQVDSRMSGSASRLHELFMYPRKIEQTLAQIKTLEHNVWAPVVTIPAAGTLAAISCLSLSLFVKR